MFDCFIYLLGIILALAALEALIIVFLLIKDWRRNQRLNFFADEILNLSPQKPTKTPRPWCKQDFTTQERIHDK